MTTVKYKGYEIALHNNMASLLFSYVFKGITMKSNTTFVFNSVEDFQNKLDEHIRDSKNYKCIDLTERMIAAGH